MHDLVTDPPFSLAPPGRHLRPGDRPPVQEVGQAHHSDATHRHRVGRAPPPQRREAAGGPRPSPLLASPPHVHPGAQLPSLPACLPACLPPFHGSPPSIPRPPPQLLCGRHLHALRRPGGRVPPPECGQQQSAGREGGRAAWGHSHGGPAHAARTPVAAPNPCLHPTPPSHSTPPTHSPTHPHHLPQNCDPSSDRACAAPISVWWQIPQARLAAAPGVHPPPSSRAAVACVQPPPPPPLPPSTFSWAWRRCSATWGELGGCAGLMERQPPALAMGALVLTSTLSPPTPNPR